MLNILEKAEVLIPVVTPFREDWRVDYALLSELCEWLTHTGRCDGIILTGTNGEFWALSYQERVECYQTVLNNLKGKTPVIAATGCNSTKETLELTKEAEYIGADMAMVIVPPYGRPQQEEIYSHFASVASAVSFPIMIYNIPSFTGANIEPETVARLSPYEHIIAIKDEAGKHATQTADYIEITGGRLKIYNGDDKQVLQALGEGAYGLVSGGAHVIGRELKQIVKDFKSGNLQTAQENYRRLLPFLKSLHQSGRENPVSLLKSSLDVIGFHVGPPRLPFIPAKQEELTTIQSIINNLGISR